MWILQFLKELYFFSEILGALWVIENAGHKTMVSFGDMIEAKQMGI